jgi:hypothetical protein
MSHGACQPHQTCAQQETRTVNIGKRRVEFLASLSKRIELDGIGWRDFDLELTQERRHGLDMVGRRFNRNAISFDSLHLLDIDGETLELLGNAAEKLALFVKYEHQPDIATKRRQFETQRTSERRSATGNIV